MIRGAGAGKVGGWVCGVVLVVLRVVAACEGAAPWGAGLMMIGVALSVLVLRVILVFACTGLGMSSLVIGAVVLVS